MRRRTLMILCPLLIALGLAIPTLTGRSPWKLGAGRTRAAEDAAASLAAPLAADRDRAERTLVELGPAALPVLEDLPAEVAAEARLRAHRAATAIRSRTTDGSEPDLVVLERLLARSHRPPTDLLRRLGARALPLLRTAGLRRPDDPELLHLLVEHAATVGGSRADRILGEVLAAADVPAALVHRAAEALADPHAALDVPALRLLLADPWSARRAAALRVLIAHGQRLSAMETGLAVRDPRPFVRRVAAALLTDPHTRPNAIGLLGDPDARVRSTALEALRGVRDPGTLAAVRHRLSDDHARVRAAAVACLAASGETHGLRGLADDASCGVRLAVRRAVGRP